MKNNEKHVQPKNGFTTQTIKRELTMDNTAQPETFGMQCKRLQARLNEISEKGIEKGWK
jgi:hypothetical protein